MKKLLIALSLILLSTSTVCARPWDGANYRGEKYIYNVGNKVDTFTVVPVVSFESVRTTVEAKIRSNWIPPKTSKNKHAVVLVKIAKDGKLISARLLEPSGNADFDNSIKNAILKSTPFQALPDTFEGNYAEFQYTFKYSPLLKAL